MTFSVQGQAVSRGVAIGRAVLVASSRLDVAHYFIADEQVEAELQRISEARERVVSELQRTSRVCSGPRPVRRITSSMRCSTCT